MKKPALKKQRSQKEYTGDDVKRYLGSLSEDFQHKVSAIGEQFGGLNKKLDEHGRILDSHTVMIAKLAMDVTEVKEDIVVIKKDMTVVKGDITVMKGDIQTIKTDLKQKVDRSEFARLERRVISLESLVHGGKSRK